MNNFDYADAKPKRKIRPNPRPSWLKILGALGAGVVIAFIMNTLKPPTQTVVKVDARLGWQSAGVQIKSGMWVSFNVIDGTWTNWKGVVEYTTGAGTPGYLCGEAMNPEDCVEPLPFEPADALIGRVGNEVFMIGHYPPQQILITGELELRINDGDPGLGDNDGMLAVRVKWSEP
jgi:hypothetical protein